MDWESLKKTKFYKEELNKVQGCCELFYDQKETDPFSSQLGNRLQKIGFDFPWNIDSEINYFLDFLAGQCQNGKEQTKLNVWKTLKYLIEFQRKINHHLTSKIEEHSDIHITPNGIKEKKE